MVNADIDLLKALMLNDTDMAVKLSSARLQACGFTKQVDKHGNIIFSRGKGKKTVLIAHTDTVCTKEPAHMVQVSEFLIGLDNIGSQCGIGADDRAGMAACVQIAKSMPNEPLIILFCALEERGCIGSNALDLSHLNDSGIMIQLDRKITTIGKGDIITYTNGVTICSTQFQNHIKNLCLSHGYHFESGIYTDVGTLKIRGVQSSGINMSIGYMREHTQNEVLHIPSYESALQLCTELIQHCRGKSFEYVSKKPHTHTYHINQKNKESLPNHFNVVGTCYICGLFTKVAEYNDFLYCKGCEYIVLQHKKQRKNKKY
jgi:putative aminopeptidase FrvX